MYTFLISINRGVYLAMFACPLVSLRSSLSVCLCPFDSIHSYCPIVLVR